MLPSVTLVIILLVVGAVLLLLETMLPGLVAGILGFCCLVAGLALAYSTVGARIANLLLSGDLRSRLLQLLVAGADEGGGRELRLQIREQCCSGFVGIVEYDRER